MMSRADSTLYAKHTHVGPHRHLPLVPLALRRHEPADVHRLLIRQVPRRRRPPAHPRVPPPRPGPLLGLARRAPRPAPPPPQEPQDELPGRLLADRGRPPGRLDLSLDALTLPGSPRPRERPMTG